MLLFAVLLHAASQLQASGHAALERLLNAQIIKAPLVSAIDFFQPGVTSFQLHAGMLGKAALDALARYYPKKINTPLLPKTPNFAARQAS